MFEKPWPGLSARGLPTVGLHRCDAGSASAPQEPASPQPLDTLPSWACAGLAPTIPTGAARRLTAPFVSETTSPRPGPAPSLLWMSVKEREFEKLTPPGGVAPRGPTVL